jgi:hypothetical protein
MKGSIPTPVVVIIVVAVVALVGVWIWKGSAGSAGAGEIKSMTAEVNKGKPQTEAVPAAEAAGDAMLMGGAKKGGR